MKLCYRGVSYDKCEHKYDLPQPEVAPRSAQILRYRGVSYKSSDLFQLEIVPQSVHNLRYRGVFYVQEIRALRLRPTNTRIRSRQGSFA